MREGARGGAAVLDCLPGPGAGAGARGTFLDYGVGLLPGWAELCSGAVFRGEGAGTFQACGVRDAARGGRGRRLGLEWRDVARPLLYTSTLMLRIR